MECPNCKETLVLTTKQVKTDKVEINNIPAWGCLDCKVSYLNKEINDKVNEFKQTKEGVIDFKKEVKKEAQLAKKEEEAKNKVRKPSKLGEVKKENLRLEAVIVSDYPVCPSCMERNYKIEDYATDEAGMVIFYAKCKCKTVFAYKKSIASITAKKEVVND